MPGTEAVEVRLTDTDGLTFEAALPGDHRVVMDAAAASGGRQRGGQPMQLLLASLAGCTAMDVMAILRKMRQPVEAYAVQVSGVRAETEPKVFTHISVKHIVTGAVDPERLAHAIALSDTRYCSVGAMLRRATQVTTSYEIRPPRGGGEG